MNKYIDTMPYSTSITRKTKTSIVCDNILKKIADGLFPETCYEGVEWLTTFGDRPFIEAIEAYVVDKEMNTSWGVTAIEMFGTVMSQELKNLFISKITSPMQALRLYADADYLSERDMKLLKGKFEGKLPNAERWLVENNMIREGI